MKNNQSRWSQNGSDFYVQDVARNVSNLPVGVYTIQFHPTQGPYLSAHDPFEMPSKVYGLESNFVDRLLHSFTESGRASTACLLSGMQGAGKTVTAKVAALRTGLPIILVQSRAKAVFDFIGELPQDLVLIFDEVEKVYDQCEEGEWVPLLSTLDGLSNANYKRLWILTCNDSKVSPFIIDRVGRVRYHKKFSGLSEDQIREIVTDKLPELSEKDQNLTVGALRRLRTRTVDAVTGYCSEVALMGTTNPDEVMKDLNLLVKPRKYIFKAKPLNDNGTPTDIPPYDMWTFLEGTTNLETKLLTIGHTIDHQRTRRTIGTVIGLTPELHSIVERYGLNWSPDEQSTFVRGDNPQWTNGEKLSWEKVCEILNNDPILWECWIEEVPVDLNEEEVPVFSYKQFARERQIVDASEFGGGED